MSCSIAGTLLGHSVHGRRSRARSFFVCPMAFLRSMRRKRALVCGSERWEDCGHLHVSLVRASFFLLRFSDQAQC